MDNFTCHRYANTNTSICICICIMLKICHSNTIKHLEWWLVLIGTTNTKLWHGIIRSLSVIYRVVVVHILNQTHNAGSDYTFKYGITFLLYKLAIDKQIAI